MPVALATGETVAIAEAEADAMGEGTCCAGVPLVVGSADAIAVAATARPKVVTKMPCLMPDAYRSNGPLNLSFDEDCVRHWGGAAGVSRKR